MSSLKDYRDRIISVKSTRKITLAMKMVAASKLKKAEEASIAGLPYAQAIEHVMDHILAAMPLNESSPPLLKGTGAQDVHLFVVLTSDKGLCGGFNSNLVRLVRADLKALQAEGKTVKMICVGRKGIDMLKRNFKQNIIETQTGIGADNIISFREAEDVGNKVLALFEAGEFDVCTLYHNVYKNVLTQIPEPLQLIPVNDASLDDEEDEDIEDEKQSGPEQIYAYEPEEQAILSALLPRNLNAQIYHAMLDSFAGEQAARMTSMDNATRAAEDMIDTLSLQYNRERQAVITKELIEIVSGAEAT
jgi:F-type H+-transporting ATPase subunit gamma